MCVGSVHRAVARIDRRGRGDYYVLEGAGRGMWLGIDGKWGRFAGAEDGEVAFTV